jgi:hypothetical protein
MHGLREEVESDRIHYSQRLDGLRSHFDRMLDQAIKMLSGLQSMTDEVQAFENEENTKRKNISAVFFWRA